MPVRRQRYGPLYVDRSAFPPAQLEARTNASDESNDLPLLDENSLTPRQPQGPSPASFPGPAMSVASVMSPNFPTISSGISNVKQASPTSTSWAVVTMTSFVFQTVTPTVTALAAAQASDGPPFLPPGDRPKHPKKEGLSEGTEHLLIAAGSIGATIILVLLIYGIFLMRRKGLTFAEVLTGRRKKDTYHPEAVLAPYEYPEPPMKSVLLEPQPAVLARHPTNASDRPLIERNPSNRTERSALRINTTNNANKAERSFYDETSPSRRVPPPAAHNRNISETPSSPVLPLQNQGGRRSPSTPSTRNTRDFDPYTGQPLDQVRSPPTFRQFLANRRISIAPKISRFSWTTSNAPQTPRDDLRMSVRTDRSSVPRFRTVESWVGQQMTRVQGMLSGSGSSEMSEQQPRGNSMFPVPDVPREYQQEPAAPAPLRINRNPSRRQEPQPLLPDTDEEDTVAPLRETEGDKVAALRRDTVGARSDATVFRQHPGEEVVIPRGSLVPSEVLNAKVQPLAL